MNKDNLNDNFPENNSNQNEPNEKSLPVHEEDIKPSVEQPSQDSNVSQEPPKFELNIDESVFDINDPVEEIRVDEKPKPKKKKRKSKWLSAIISLIVILAVSGLLSVFIITAAKDVLGLDKANKEITVTIEKGASTKEIAEILKNNGVIQNDIVYRLYSKFRKADGSYQYGEYKLNSNMSYDEIITNLKKSSVKKEVVTVVIPEGYSVTQIAKVLEENEVCKAKDFIDMLNKTEFNYEFTKTLKKNELRYHRYEGYLFPDTYEFYTNDTPENVAKRMFANFDKKVGDRYRVRAKEVGIEFDDLITLASIIQAEAPDTKNMNMVSSVFHNRMKNSKNFPKLQSDPTKKYVKESLLPYVKDEKYEKAYDTYICNGLPAGPIGNPGLDAIEAALYPDKTDYLYFCSNLKTKQFYYAKTLSQHNVNLKKAGLS